MRFTPNYKLGSFEVGEQLLPLEDSRRFLTIDRQLLGLFQVFGNGVISGWTVSSGGGLSVSITPGRGHVNFLAAQTTDPRTVGGLSPNATNYIMVQGIETTRFDRDVAFFASTTDLSITSENVLLLAAVTTNATSVESIDTTNRNDISFVETIKTLIDQHRHRGGNDNPSKIDLSSEVTGQLPGFRIDDLDASKITTGRLDPARIPPLEHSDLLNSGVLTHPQLDSFVRDLSNDNTRLLGELSSADLLQAYLAMKHIWNEVDKYTFNMLVMIPGITPDSFSDLVATTALFDRTDHSIQGVPSLAGELLTHSISSVQDFNGNVSNINIDIRSDDGVDSFRLVKPFTATIVESFDNVFSSGTSVSGWDLETVGANDTTSFKTDGSQKVDGPFSAKWDVDQSVRIQLTKQFSSAQDWTTYNEIEVSIETRSSAHGQIRLQLLTTQAGQEVVLEDFLILDTNETTTGFERSIFDITNVTRTSVTGVRIYSDSSLGWDLSAFVVNLDRIRLNNNLFYKQTGSIRFRYQTPQKSKWAAISWDGDENGGTISARARTASNFAVMDETTAITFGPVITASGGDPDVDDNTNIEFEILLTSDAGKVSTPVIRSITLSFITSSTSSGLTIDTATDFLRGAKFSNTRVQSITGSSTPDDGEVVIDGRVEVDDVVYGNIRSVQQVDAFGTPVLGLTGSTLPLSPLQASATQFILRQSSFDGVATVIRNEDKTYLVTDTLNDRILLLDRNGEVLKGLASNNARALGTEVGLFPLTATYNSESNTIYVCWTQNVAFSNVDLSAFTINGSGIVVKLSNTTDKVVRVQGRNADLDSGNITAIEVSAAHAAQIDFFLNSQGVSDARLFIDIEPDAVAGGLNLDNTSYATLATARGLPMTVAPITFVRGIFRPISVSITSAGNWLVGNAKPLITNDDGTDVLTGVGKDEIVSVIEIDPDSGEIIFSDDSVDFSLVTLGGAIEYNERYVAVAGITTDTEQPATSQTTTTTRATLGLGTTTVSQTTIQPTVVQDTTSDAGATTTTSVTSELDQIAQYRGRVKVIEKRSGRVITDEPTSDGTYGADVQIDSSGNLVIAEKSFDGTQGRGRVVKVDDLGNVFFQFGFKDLTSPNDVRIRSNGNLVVST